MACGHCRLKIESELRSAGFSKIKFDMINDLVMIDEGNLSLMDAYKAIEKAGYLVDKSYRSKNSQIVLKISNLIDKNNVSEIKKFLLDESVSDMEFNVNDQTLKIMDTDKDIEEIIELIEILGYDVEVLN